MRTITDKQARFIDEYLKDGNGQAAAIRAGYPEKNAKVMASKVLKLNHVSTFLLGKLAEKEAETQAIVNPLEQGEVNQSDQVNQYQANRLTNEEDEDESVSEIINGSTGLVDRMAKPIKLSKLRHVRLEQATVYREMRAGAIEAALGTKLIWSLDKIRDAITGEEFERQLEALESQQQKLLMAERV